MTCVIAHTLPLSDCNYLIANATQGLAFKVDQSVSPADQVLLSARFRVAPSDTDDIGALMGTRPDLLVGRLDWTGKVIRTQSGRSQLDPHTSVTVRDIAHQLGMGVRQLLFSSIEHGPGEAWYSNDWTVPVGDMTGDWPERVYHGTACEHWSAIDQHGLITTGAPNWPQGAINSISLSASPYVAAFHAACTAFKTQTNPIVLACAKPAVWDVDYDVKRDLVSKGLVLPADARRASQEAGLMETPNPIPRAQILAVYTPSLRTDWRQWTRLV